MVTVGDIYTFIDTIAPYDTAEEWDNTGLSVGGVDDKVNKIGFALDLTSDTVSQAKKEGCDLIVTHHPLIFDPLKSVNTDSCVYRLIENKIAHISAHTNYDIAPNGVNEQLIKRAGLKLLSKVEKECLYICETDTAQDIDAFAADIKTKLGTVVRYNKGRGDINRVAVCSGSGSDYINIAKEHGCDALLTGDGKHHAFIDANEAGISLVCAGHFETEAFSMHLLCERITERFGIEGILLKQETSIKTI